MLDQEERMLFIKSTNDKNPKTDVKILRTHYESWRMRVGPIVETRGPMSPTCS